MKKYQQKTAAMMIALAMALSTAAPAFAETPAPENAAGDAATHVFALSEEAPSDVDLLAEGTQETEDEEVSEEPEVQTGWQTIGGQTCYIDPDTEEKVTGVTKINGKYYCFNKSGALVKNGWMSMYGCKWHADGNGIVQTGLKTIKGNKYLFDKNGGYETLDNGEEICYYGVMYDVGIYKNYVISYTGKLYKMPKKKKDKKCKKMAKLIAKCCGKNCKKMSDIEKVSRASITVFEFYCRCKYSMKAKNYNKPYGVFYSKKCSCAGTTRALGLVLKKMGFKWKHKNENKYKHQWCIVKMDGKKGWADGMIGGAGYGKHPAAY